MALSFAVRQEHLIATHLSKDFPEEERQQAFAVFPLTSLPLSVAAKPTHKATQLLKWKVQEPAKGRLSTAPRGIEEILYLAAHFFAFARWATRRMALRLIDRAARSQARSISSYCSLVIPS